MSKKNKSVPKTRQTSQPLLTGEIHEIWGRKKWKNLFGQTDISSIVIFRIFFGLVLFVEVCRYINNGWIERYWLIPKYHFTYWPFNFLSPLPGNGMNILFYIMAVFAICITIGLFYRFSMACFTLLFSYSFFLEQTRYLNHLYLVILFGICMIFVPAHRSASIDAKLFKKIHSETVPVWSVWLLRFMAGLPYFFGGLAKINSDWLQGQPLKMWLAKDTNFPVIGQYFTENWMILFMAYSGLIIDLLTFPLLLFKRTRTWGFILITTFHLMNSELFDIGIFPWFMIGASTIFFKPDWFRKLVNGFSVNRNKWPMITSKELITAPVLLSRKQKFVAFVLAAWVIIQVALPLRHFLYPGSVHWTEEGHKYSWHMKLRSKRGEGQFIAKDKKTGQEWKIDENNYMVSWQKKKVKTNPELIWQFCKYVKDDFMDNGIDVEVHADIRASLNGRKYQQLIDPKVDLASVPRPIFSAASWIIPLTTPLSERLKVEENDEAN